MKTLTVNIDLDRKCDRCGEPGATDTGICLRCASKLITGAIMAKDAIDLGIIGSKLEHLDGLCRAKREAATDFKEACKVIGQSERIADEIANAVALRLTEK